MCHLSLSVSAPASVLGKEKEGRVSCLRLLPVHACAERETCAQLAVGLSAVLSARAPLEIPGRLFRSRRVRNGYYLFLPCVPSAASLAGARVRARVELVGGVYLGKSSPFWRASP